MAAPVFCTKIASKLTRTYTDRHGLKNLVSRTARRRHLQAAAARATGARPSSTTRSANTPPPTCATSTACARCCVERLEREGRTRHRPGLLRFPAHPRAARPRRLGRPRHIQPRLRRTRVRAAMVTSAASRPRKPRRCAARGSASPRPAARTTGSSRCSPRSLPMGVGRDRRADDHHAAQPARRNQLPARPQQGGGDRRPAAGRQCDVSRRGRARAARSRSPPARRCSDRAAKAIVRMQRPGRAHPAARWARQRRAPSRAVRYPRRGRRACPTACVVTAADGYRMIARGVSDRSARKDAGRQRRRVGRDSGGHVFRRPAPRRSRRAHRHARRQRAPAHGPRQAEDALMNRHTRRPPPAGAAAGFALTLAAMAGIQVGRAGDRRAQLERAGQLRGRPDRTAGPAEPRGPVGQRRHHARPACGCRRRAPRSTTPTPGSLKIQRIVATGGVTVDARQRARAGDVAVYDFNRRVITMAGNVRLNRGGDTLNGGRLVIDLKSGVSSVDGRANGSSSVTGAVSGSGSGRVSGSFSVPAEQLAPVQNARRCISTPSVLSTISASPHGLQVADVFEIGVEPVLRGRIPASVAPR